MHKGDVPELETYGVTQAARALGVSPSTVRAWRAAGRLRAGGRWTRAELEQAAQAVPPARPRGRPFKPPGATAPAAAAPGRPGHSPAGGAPAPASAPPVRSGVEAIDDLRLPEPQQLEARAPGGREAHAAGPADFFQGW